MNRKVNYTKNIQIERIWAMPNKNTFDIPPINALLQEEVDSSDYWIDPFANTNKIATVTNDLNTEYDTDYHLDALDFLKQFADESVDGVLYDPPYSPRQVSECYNNVGYNVTWDTTKASFWGNHKREISRIVKLGGKVITFGWNSGGIGYKYGFEILRILLVPHGGWHNDTICTVEVKTHSAKDDSGQYDASQLKLFDMNTSSKDRLTSKDKMLVNKLKQLPIDYWDFKDDATKEYTHGIHNYPAMMVCPISRNIIRIVQEVCTVDSLFDPFCGSGTVMVEGMLSGIENVAGNDINPLALMLTKAKTTRLDIFKLQDAYDNLLATINSERFRLDYILEAIDSYIINILKLDVAAAKGWGDNAPAYLRCFCEKNGIKLDIPDFKNIGYWFRPRVILELTVIKAAIKAIKDNNIRNYIYIAFSETLRLVSNRRNGEFKMFRMKPEKVRSFEPDVLGEFEKILTRNIAKMDKFCKKLDELHLSSNVEIYKNNSCSLEDVPDNFYSLLITSPPYGDSRTTVAYGEYSRLSLQWIDQFNLADKDIMGIDKKLMGGKKYRNGFEYTLQSETLRTSLEKIMAVDVERAGDVYSFYLDLDASIRKCTAKTKSGGYHFWVVGNRTVKGELLLTDVIITELAKQYGMVHLHTIDRNIPSKVMPSRNSPTNVAGATSTTMTNEHIVVLKKI